VASSIKLFSINSQGIMDTEISNAQGYVYILQVKDINLPVCKIGVTTRTPYQRCAEINVSSTGDFIWEVAHYVAVNDCMKLEALVHQKLAPLRQKRREFFNLNPSDAYQALCSIMEHQDEFTLVDIIEPEQPEKPSVGVQKRHAQGVQRNSRANESYVELLDAFTNVLNIKGRPFGQLNKPYFGMSDGNEGVQWSTVVFTDTGKARMGVNLEGMKYANWPIASFLISELQNPELEAIKGNLSQPDEIFVRITRDAWQVTSRPFIVEEYIGGKEHALPEIDEMLWRSMLNESLGCLDETKRYRGRKSQEVTLANKQKNGEQKRVLPVSPHLYVWTEISMEKDISDNVKAGLAQLALVYEWIARQCL
jgi:hypothetical protein